MKFLWWRIRYAFWMHYECRRWISFAWQAANANSAEDFEIDEYSPRESVNIELSYWY